MLSKLYITDQEAKSSRGISSIKIFVQAQFKLASFRLRFQSDFLSAMEILIMIEVIVKEKSINTINQILKFIFLQAIAKYFSKNKKFGLIKQPQKLFHNSKSQNLVFQAKNLVLTPANLVSQTQAHPLNIFYAKLHRLNIHVVWQINQPINTLTKCLPIRLRYEHDSVIDVDILML
ncbi:unnamed protein product [Paramecium octaurelia]|uniref:Uncharacterized protein n=1 Tax=Paramecium octaurelia TaxID=43137 RepID=A0A8S1UQY9_PAROT|nr:unnamed protein product [Paramecium octaurelia]